MHGLKIDTALGEVITARSRKGTFERAIESWTDETIGAAASQLSAARASLQNALDDALGPHHRSLRFFLEAMTHELHDLGLTEEAAAAASAKLGKDHSLRVAMRVAEVDAEPSGQANQNQAASGQPEPAQ